MHLPEAFFNLALIKDIMGKIFCLMGKSACGKDTIYKKILTDDALPLKHWFLTPPGRSGTKRQTASNITF